MNNLQPNLHHPNGLRSGIAKLWHVLISPFCSLTSLLQRERTRVLQEVAKVKGLMPLLMKQRNGQKWNPHDKNELMVHLKQLSTIIPYLPICALPGTFVLLPLLAAWLDRRAKNRSR